jgi:hypothetical protein
VLNGCYLFSIVYRLPFVKICDVGEKLLPAKCREHYEKVFSEFNEWKEKRGVMTINEEVIDLDCIFSLSY